MRRTDNVITFVCQLSWNVGTSTSWNPLGLSRPVMGLLFIYTTHNRRSKSACMGCWVIEWVLPDILKNGGMFIVMVKECKICSTAWKYRWSHYIPSRTFWTTHLTQHHNWEYLNLQQHCCENPKPHIIRQFLPVCTLIYAISLFCLLI